MEDNVFRPHSLKQQQAILSNKKFNICGTGIQWGKTRVGAVWMKRKCHEFVSEDDNFIICAPTYKIMMQSTIPAFLPLMKGCGQYNKSDNVFKVKGGGTIYIRSMNDPDSIVGITNVRALWGDEAGLFTLYAFENIQARCAFKDAPMMFTTSPYSLNWIYKDLIRPYKKGGRDDIFLVQAASNENPYFPKEEFERRKNTMDPRRFRMIFGGEWERPEGLVYDCFSEEYNIIDSYHLDPNTTTYYAGVDWGFRDPFVIIVRAISTFGDHIDVAEFYKSGMKPSDIIDTMIKFKSVYNIKTFFCDPSRPDMILECQTKGVPAIAANNDIKSGIDKYYELIRSKKYKIFRGQCRHLIDEIDSYHYPEEKDLKPDQNKQKNFEVPVDQNNHCCDAARYVTLGTHVFTEQKRMTKNPEENYYRRKFG